MALPSYSGSYSSFDYEAVSSSRHGLYGQAKSSVSYKIFDECSQIVEDANWKQLFSNMARGNFSHGLSFDGNRIMVGSGKKREYIELSDQYELAIEQLMDFIMSYTSIRSTKDKKRVKKRLEQARVCDDETVRMAMFEKSQRELLFVLIYSFVDRSYRSAGWHSRVREFDLFSDNLTADILDSCIISDVNFIQHTIQAGKIHAEDITITDQKIEKIRGVFLGLNGFETTSELRPESKKRKGVLRFYLTPVVTYSKRKPKRIPVKRRGKTLEKLGVERESVLYNDSVIPSTFSYSDDISSYWHENAKNKEKTVAK